MTDNLFIPIQSTSLPHYFSRAIILPSQYFQNKPEDKIQDIYSNSIILSKNKWVTYSDCSIEVVLTDIENLVLIPISENFFICNIPIPISRVVKIHFLNQKQKEITVWNTNNGSAFIPERIIEIEQTKNIHIQSNEELINYKGDLIQNDLSEKIKRFDILLGGFSFMRIGGYPKSNFSENYFPTFSYFNKLIEEQTNVAVNEKRIKFNIKFTGLFSRNISEWSKWQNFIYQNVAYNDLEKLARNEGVKIEKKLGIIDINTINKDSHIYDIAILATYGEKKPKSTDDLVNDLKTGKIPQNKVEEISILFGLNNGYSKLRNKYKVGNDDYIVKFNLESQLDYYIIESIFQFVFYGNKNNYNFQYIDEWCPKLKQDEKLKTLDSFKILDTIVTLKPVKSPLEIYLQNTYADISIFIYNSVKQWIPPFAKIDTIELDNFLENKIKVILNNSINTFQKKIEDEYSLTLKAKEYELINLHNAEKEKLIKEIENLKNEIAKLIFEKSNNTLISNSSENNITDEKTTAFDSINSENDISTKILKDLESLELKELKKLAKEKGIKESILKDYSKKNIKKLIELIRNNSPSLF